MPIKKKSTRAKAKKRPKYLEANGICIKDMKGKVRAFLSAEGVDGHVSFNLYGDPDTHVAISAGPKGHAGMDLSYKSRCALSVGVKNGAAGITICDQLGRPSFFIAASTNEDCGRIRIYHDGKLIWKTA